MVCSRTVIPLTWKHVETRSDPEFVVAPDERLGWGRTIGLGAQHVVAMFGATFLVPVLTGFPPATTLLFSGVGTILFLLITGNRLPSYLGSSFSVIAPVTAAMASHGTGSALLYGLVGVLGVRIWLTNHVDFSKPLNQMTAAIPLIIGIADFTWQAGDLTFTGIALGSIAALLVYHGMRLLGFRTSRAGG